MSTLGGGGGALLYISDRCVTQAILHYKFSCQSTEFQGLVLKQLGNLPTQVRKISLCKRESKMLIVFMQMLQTVTLLTSARLESVRRPRLESKLTSFVFISTGSSPNEVSWSGN